MENNFVWGRLFSGLKWQKIGSKSVHRRGQCIAGPAQDCRSLYMGLAGLLKAGWLNAFIYLLEEPILSLIGGTYLIF